MKFTMRFFIKIALVVVFCVFPFGSANAAKIFLEQVRTGEMYGSGESVHVDLKLDSRGQNVNALEAMITYPTDALSLERMSEDDSIISHWVRQPNFQEEGKIVFSGIVPGGFNGEDGMILAFDFSVKQEVPARLEVKDVKVLLNDGKGTELATISTGVDINIAIGNETVKKEGESSSIKDDNTPPEEFTPVVSRDPDIFDGAWFVSFYAKDDNFGISHYEVLESPKRINFDDVGQEALDWEKAQSPHLLKDQTLGSYIYVKAVDRAGNETIAWDKPHKDLAGSSGAGKAFWSKWLWVLFVLIIIAIIVLNKIYKKRKANYV